MAQVDAESVRDAVAHTFLAKARHITTASEDAKALSIQ